jgi:four helix bundle protein
MPPRDLRDRTGEFSLRIVRFCSALPRAWAAQGIANQLFDAGTAVGANYRAARRARSHREFVARVGVVLEEADESSFWLALLKRSGLSSGPELEDLLKEAGELTAIFTASHKTAKGDINARS